MTIFNIFSSQNYIIKNSKETLAYNLIVRSSYNHMQFIRTPKRIYVKNNNICGHKHRAFLIFATCKYDFKGSIIKIITEIYYASYR